MGECKRTGCPFYSNAIEMCELGNRYCDEDEYAANILDMAMNESCFYVQNAKDLWRWDIVHRSTRKIVASILCLSTGFEYIAVNEKGVMCHGPSCRTVLEALDSYREDFEVKVV